MEVKAFKNGNFNVKRSVESDGLIHDLINSHELDFVVAGDEGCVNNYDMYYPLYNAYTDLLYLPTGMECIQYDEGKVVKLIGRELDEDERKELNEMFGW